MCFGQDGVSGGRFCEAVFMTSRYLTSHLDAEHVEEHVVRDVVGGVELVGVAVQDGLARRRLRVGLYGCLGGEMGTSVAL